MIETFNVQQISINKDFILIRIDSKEIKIPLDKISQKLKNADDFQRNLYKISPSGYGIHWPLIDEDLSVPALLKEFENKNP